MKPEELIYEIQTRLAEKSCTEKEQKMLKKILPTLKKGGNNMVFIGKLKK